MRGKVVYINGKPMPETLVLANGTYPDRDFSDPDESWVTKTSARYHEQLGGHGYDVFQDSRRRNQTCATSRSSAAARRHS